MPKSNHEAKRKEILAGLTGHHLTNLVLGPHSRTKHGHFLHPGFDFFGLWDYLQQLCARLTFTTSLKRETPHMQYI